MNELVEIRGCQLTDDDNILHWDINVGCSHFSWGERMFVFQCLMGGWWGEYSYRCQPVDYTNSPSANRVSAQNMQTNNEHETHLQYSTLSL